MISGRVGVIALPMVKRDLLRQNRVDCAISPWGLECSDYLGCSGYLPRAWTTTSATGGRTAAEEVSSVPEMARQAVREVVVFQPHIHPPFEGAVARP